MSDYINSKGAIYLKDLLAEPGANGILSDYQDHTDPKYIGPGTWNLIHRRAFKAQTHEQQLAFIEEMKEVCYGFPCMVCKGHCTEYIKNHPLEEYLGVMVDIDGVQLPIGLFVWTWKFHNAVNARIKKPIMNWDTAYNLYSTSESLVCSKNCLEAAGPADGLEHTTAPIVPKIPEFKINTVGTTNPLQPFRLISVKRK